MTNRTDVENPEKIYTSTILFIPIMMYYYNISWYKLKRRPTNIVQEISFYFEHLDYYAEIENIFHLLIH